MAGAKSPSGRTYGIGRVDQLWRSGDFEERSQELGAPVWGHEIPLESVVVDGDRGGSICARPDEEALEDHVLGSVRFGHDLRTAQEQTEIERESARGS